MLEKYLLLLPTFILLNLLGFCTSQDYDCCISKTVGGIEYRLVNPDGLTTGYRCKNNCIYEKVGFLGSKFCFDHGTKPVVCMEEFFRKVSTDVIPGIIKKILDQYSDLAANGSFSNAKDKLESFTNNMLSSTGLDPTSIDPLQDAFAIARPLYFGAPVLNIERIEAGLVSIMSEVRLCLSRPPKTVNHMKEKIQTMQEVVHQKYVEDAMFNCEYGLSLLALHIVESMVTLFFPVSQGGQDAGKSLFKAMYANTGTDLPQQTENDYTTVSVRAIQGSVGCILIKLIKFAIQNFPADAHFMDLGLSDWLPYGPDVTDVIIAGAEMGSRLIISEIFGDLIPSN